MRSIDRRRPLVLPSHGLPFKACTRASASCCEHHAERFAEALEACAERRRARSTCVPVLFKRQLDLHQMTFAMGESLAHLHALWSPAGSSGRLGADGVIRFRTA